MSKGAGGILIAVVIIAVLFAGIFVIAPMISGAPLFTAGPGADGPVECDDDGLVRLKAAYNDKLSDDVASVAVDAEVYQLIDGRMQVISTTDDETSATHGSYNEVDTNLLTCGETYEVWLGDETEEYFRKIGPFVATGSDKRITVTDGVVVGTPTYTGKDGGTLESPINITMGSGASTHDLTLVFQSSDSDQGHEAPNGLILAGTFNDSAWKTVEPSGLSNFDGTMIETNGQPIRTTSCPDIARTGLTTTGTNNKLICWLLPVTSVYDGARFDIDFFIELEASIDPGLGDADCDGNAVGGCAIQFAVFDQNYFKDTETAGAPMTLGYQDDDEANLGATDSSVTVLTS